MSIAKLGAKLFTYAGKKLVKAGSKLETKGGKLTEMARNGSSKVSLFTTPVKTSTKVTIAALLGSGIAGIAVLSNKEEKEPEKAKSTDLKTKAEQAKKPEQKKEPEQKFVKRGDLSVPEGYKNQFYGADGVKAETVAKHDRNGAPECIVYKKDGKFLQAENFDEKGNLTSYRVYGDKTDNGFQEYTEYDSKGNITSYTAIFDNHIMEQTFEDAKPGDLDFVQIDTKKSQLLYKHYKKDKDGESVEYFNNPDGSSVSKTTMSSADHYGTRATEYDKNGNVSKSTTHGYYNYNGDRDYDTHITKYRNGKAVQEDVLDVHDKLKYTVYPKYNKDGLLVKNDTVRNK